MKLKVTGMTCGHCVASVKKALESVPGVSEANVELAAGEAVVEGNADVEALCAAVREEGFEAEAA